MALVVESYGNGQLGDVAIVTSTINSYARVTELTSFTVTINETNQVTGTATFNVGAKILLHVSATTGEDYKAHLGKWGVATVTGKNANVLAVDKDLTAVIPPEEISKYYVQAVAIPQYQNLTLDTGTVITPPVFNMANHHGGIVAIMCSESLQFAGGSISLTDRGIPTTGTALRPMLKQEIDGTDDIDLYSGWENYCKEICPLNVGDGIAFIFTKKLVGNDTSRIGNSSTYGCQYYRGATNSVGSSKPAKVTNIGGSSIVIAAETIVDFNVKMLAKYRSTTSAAGQGLCRCYIASETKLVNDEGLYSYDCISNPSRLAGLNIKNYGDGSLGDLNNVTDQLNNYAKITAVEGNQVTYKDKTTVGITQIAAGALVMIHVNQKGSTNTADAGKFMLANVLSDSGTVLTLDTALPTLDIKNYHVQVISIPQTNNFTLSTENSATPKFSTTKYVGGIFAIAVKNTCNLTNGIINVEDKGSYIYGSKGLTIIGNAHDSDKLPIGTGQGSVFILAKNLVMNNATRIGATYDGAAFGGHAYCNNTDKGLNGGYKSRAGTTSSYVVSTGSGKSGGNYNDGTYSGGYGSNGCNGSNNSDTNSYVAGKHGAHIMIIADTITGFNQSAISTGGGGGRNTTSVSLLDGRSGGAGYGGGGKSSGTTYSGGAYNGGGFGAIAGGGGSGWAFVYCNHVVNQDTTGTVYKD